MLTLKVLQVLYINVCVCLCLCVHACVCVCLLKWPFRKTQVNDLCVYMCIYVCVCVCVLITLVDYKNVAPIHLRKCEAKSRTH
jgi:hypothetical protein